MMVIDDELKLNKAIGSKLRLFRKHNSIRKKELCRIFSVSTQQLNKYESGENRISAAKLYIFLKHYGLDSSYFLGDNESKKLEKVSELFYNFSRLKDNNMKKTVLELIKNVVGR
jgi:transcriptional regulator with XRE-family HTH domain